MEGYGVDHSSEELTLIDSGIRDLKDVPLSRRLVSLNLHCNQIRRISHLDMLQYLKHLDLSGNQITRIQGLENLVSLRTLNLASNLIQFVEGLQGLRSLVKLNLSYNQVNDVTGLQQLAGKTFKLTQLELQGNKLQSLQHLLQSIQGCVNVRNLVLSQGGSSNPLCQGEYKASVWSTLPHLEVLDRTDRLGRPCQTDDVLADIPGLEQFMDYLLSNSSSDVDPVGVATPNIDAALELFKQRGATTPELSTTDHETSGTTASNQRNDHKCSDSPLSSHSTKFMKEENVDHESRLERLEDQLSQLLKATQESIKSREQEIASQSPRAVPKRKPRRDTDLTDESETEVPSPGSSSRAAKGGAAISQRSVLPKSKKPSTKQTNVDASSSSSQTPTRQGRGKKATPRSLEGVRVVNPIDGPTAEAADQEKRHELQLTYVSLMQELETERERRWKAEEAAKKLAEHIRHLQEQARERQNVEDIAIQATTRLKQALTNEREVKVKLQAQNELLQEQLDECNTALKQGQKNTESLRETLRSMEESAAKLEAEKLKQVAHENKKAQEAEMRGAAAKREAEMLEATVESLKGQLRQLQELLATREQEHRQQLQNRFPLHSQEIQKVVAEETSRLDNQHITELRLAQEKIDQLTKKYADLEEEFRMALQIEASRFQELQAVYEQCSSETAENKQALLAAQRKDEASNHVISELTSMVKEQKGRISELTRSKNEQTAALKERVETLEVHLEEARKRMVTLELLKQEKTKLSAQVQAQESVIEGLKSERKLWGQELAEQGATLAQDRGRLESKIEGLSAEVGSLRKELDRETDNVRIKTKIMEDQTETIRKLKDALVERDNELRAARDDSLRLQRDLEQQLAAEAAACQELQEKLDRARDRKEELKQQTLELEEQLTQSHKAHEILNQKWKEKSTLIGQLEKQVLNMKATWEAKETKLTEERDKAIQAASLAVEKMRSMDDSFRKQLDSKEASHQEELRSLNAEKQEEIDMAHRKVAEVEDEMRALLRETEMSKRGMEERVKKLTKAFTDLQTDLLS